jgi:hypothetical protein
MKTKITFLSIAIFGILAAFNVQVQSTSTGAPAGRTGSPADGATCFTAGCHMGAPVAESGLISSNIPSSGYVPGTTYQITGSISGSGNKGFQISPQATNGTYLGTLSATTGNKIVSTKYITHSSAVNQATATWTFNWTAPAAGTGDVTFYGAFAATRNTTRTSTLTISENTSVNVTELKANDFIVYPQPAGNRFTIQANQGIGQIEIFDLTGKLVYKENGMNQNILNIRVEDNLKRGFYILRLQTGIKIITKKIVLGY